MEKAEKVEVQTCLNQTETEPPFRFKVQWEAEPNTVFSVQGEQP
jgi:hypothetical protein